TTAVNPAGRDGLFYGNPGQLVTQIIAVAAVWIFAGVVTFILLKLVDLVVGLRVREEDERLGLDSSQHGEMAYQH
ncbi:MAG TPA: ammonia channel protein, partial [Dehalococcoidia bacterium]|nr:ammonia channel protein [Dehalococcoidia bacterium]